MNELTKKDTSLTLKERLALKKSGATNCLILDISSSMNIEIEPGTSRIQALRDIVKTISGNPLTIAFSDHAIVIDKNEIPNPHGSTNMSSAFQLAKSRGIVNALMLTDGEDGYPKEAIKNAAGLNLKIMYIGSGERPELLDQLAGQFATTEDLKAPKELGTKIQKLLGSSESETKKGTICL